MKKSTELKEISVNTANICNELMSNDALACMFALRYCTLNNLNNNEITSIIKKLKNSTLIEWNSCKISSCAIAALHLLGIELYSGDDIQINELIKTKFYTI